MEFAWVDFFLNLGTSYMNSIKSFKVAEFLPFDTHNIPPPSSHLFNAVSSQANAITKNFCWRLNATKWDIRFVQQCNRKGSSWIRVAFPFRSERQKATAVHKDAGLTLCVIAPVPVPRDNAWKHGIVSLKQRCNPSWVRFWSRLRGPQPPPLSQPSILSRDVRLHRLLPSSIVTLGIVGGRNIVSGGCLAVEDEVFRAFDYWEPKDPRDAFCIDFEY